MKHICGRDLLIKVTLDNMFAGIGEKLESDKLVIRSTELIPQNIQIIFGALYCPACMKTIADGDTSEIRLVCSECGKSDVLPNMCILSCNSKYVRPVFLHKDCVEQYKVYVKNHVMEDGIDFTIVDDIKLEFAK